MPDRPKTFEEFLEMMKKLPGNAPEYAVSTVSRNENSVLKGKSIIYLGSSVTFGFLVNEGKEAWHLVDLPGYGFAQTGQKQRDKLRVMIDRYCLMRKQLVNLFVLVDCRHEPQKIDLEFMEWLGENEVPFSIVFTKSDKVGKGRLSENIDNYKHALLETWEELPTIFITSAEKKEGTEEIVTYIESINADLGK